MDVVDRERFQVRCFETRALQNCPTSVRQTAMEAGLYRIPFAHAVHVPQFNQDTLVNRRAVVGAFRWRRTRTTEP